jgi:hypothetical protein
MFLSTTSDPSEIAPKMVQRWGGGGGVVHGPEGSGTLRKSRLRNTVRDQFEPGGGLSQGCANSNQENPFSRP